MKSDARWMRILAVRVLANAIIGGLWFAFVGALCGGVVGGFYGALSFDFRLNDFLLGAKIGASVGIASGVVGFLIFAIATLKAVPGDLLAPFNELKKRVCWGQLLGTLLACASFIVFESGKAALQSITLAKALDSNDSFYFICAAPVLMICGAIVAALSKRDLPKVATLNAE